MDFRCVHCGFQIRTLYLQYSPGNIRLMKCENCKAVADEYIECEIMILLIDLILHKPKAYRHLFYNLLNQKAANFEGFLWISIFVFHLLDAYRVQVLSTTEVEWSLSMSFASLVWSSGKMLIGNFIFICTLLLGARFLLNASTGFSGAQWEQLCGTTRCNCVSNKMALAVLGRCFASTVSTSRYKFVLLAILVSSYFKIFLIVMMVWKFPPSAIFIIDTFVLSSNAVALKVITGSTMTRCVGVCFSAHAVKSFADLLVKMLPPR